MAEIAGFEGRVDWGSLIDSDICAYRTFSWSLDLGVETLESTDFCSAGWKTFIAGLKGWTGSLELYTDDTTQLVPSDIGTNAVVTLYLDATNYLTGNALWNSWSPAASVDGIQTQSLGFQGTSDLTAGAVS